MSETKKIYKWWWPWQSESIESLLEGKAANGWVLKSIGGFLISFTFEKSEPSQVRYCIDYQEKETPDYLTLLEDAGWKLEKKGSGWYIWSMVYDGARPELYTDIDSLIHRSNAILGSMTVIFVTQIPVWIACLSNLDNPTPATIAGYILWAFLTAILGGMTFGTALGIRNLKRRKGMEAGKRA